MLRQLQSGTKFVARNVSSAVFQIEDLKHFDGDGIQENTTEWNIAKPYANIPGPKPLPLVGNIWKFLPAIGTYHGLDQISLHGLLHENYGAIVKLSGLKLRKDVVFLFDPEAIEKMYRNEGEVPRRLGIPSMVDYKQNVREDVFQGQTGIGTEQGDNWYAARTIANSVLMQPRSIQRFIKPTNDLTNELVTRINDLIKEGNGEMPKNFINELYSWIFESTFLISLNKPLGLFKNDVPKDPETLDFMKNVVIGYELLHDLDLKVSMFKWIAKKKFIKTMDKITRFQKKHFDEGLANMKTHETDISKMNLLEQLMTKKDVRVAYSTFYELFLGGFESATLVMAAALYYLAVNPDAQAKLRKELVEHMPHKDTPLTKELLQELKYLKAVLKETGRLAPISVGITRETPKDIVLAGYQIPENTQVVFGHMLLSRLEKYFPRSNEFIPDRWIRESGDQYVSKDAHKFTNMPFGFGPRSCVGQRLANMQMEILLAKVCRNFQISWPHEEMKWNMTMFYGVKSPLKYHFKPLSI